MARARNTVGLPVLSAPDVPLYTGDIEADIRAMNRRRAEEIGGKLSFPSKMDCPSWGIPARRCRLGSILAKQEGTTCHDCYALKGTFRFKAIDTLLEDNYRKLFHLLWTPALASQIRWEADDRFRWFLAGDLQGKNHLLNIIQICLATRHILHWLPTREGEVIRERRDLIPENLTIRESATRIDGPPPASWPWTSTVVTDAADGLGVCPSSLEGGNCADHGCTACWNREVKNVAYRRH